MLVHFPAPRRFAIAGDWHADAVYAAAAIRHARREGAEAIVHVGDFGDRFERDYLEAVDAALVEPLPLRGDEARPAPPATLMFVDGNHEDFDLLERLPRDEHGLGIAGERIRHLPRGFRWTWAGRTWVACGGATSVNRLDLEPGRSWWPQEAITEADIERVRAGGRGDVLVCHDSPAGADTPCDWAGRFPDEEVRIAAEHRRLVRAVFDAVRPAHVFHGHFHHRYDTELDGARIHGLDRDGAPFERNLLLLTMEELFPDKETS